MKQLPIEELEAGMVLAQDVYSASSATHAFLRSGYQLTWAAIDRLAGQGIERVSIVSNEPDLDVNTAPAAPQKLRIIPTSAPAPKPILSEELRREAISAVEHAFADVTVTDYGVYGSPEVFRQLDEIVEKLVRSIMGNRGLMVNIADLKSFDDYTYHHSLAVAVLAVSIGQQLGLRTRQLNRLGLAALMHDIGKTAVPLELIRKPGHLTNEEFELIKTHARAGTSYMIGSSLGDAEIWKSVLFHHERMNGSGYPNGLSGERIPLYSRIIAVADVYDALTSARPYRLPMQPFEAQEYVMGGSGTAFDYDVVTALVQKVALYPVGGVVELSNHQLAVVLENDVPMRPTVEILATGDVVDLYHDRRYLSVTIRRAVNENELSRRPAERLLRSI